MTFVPYVRKKGGSSLIKYSITIAQKDTFGTFKKKFDKVAGINKQKKTYVLAEVANSDILKNFSSVADETLVEDLRLKSSDNLFAF